MKTALLRLSILTTALLLSASLIAVLPSWFNGVLAQTNKPTSRTSLTPQSKSKPTNQQRAIKIEPESSSPDIFAKLTKEDEHRFALIVGVNDYEPPIRQLSAPNEDANRLAEALVKFAAFPKRNITLLTSNQINPALRPTKNNIIRQIVAFQKNLQGNDLLLIAFIGHGYEMNNRGYILPMDGIVANLPTLEQTALSRDYIQEQIGMMQPKQIIFIMDACRNSPESRGLRVNQDAKVYMPNLYARDRITKVGLYAQMFAASPGQEAMEANGEGFFTSALVQGLEEATNEDGDVTLGELKRFIERRVPQIAQSQLLDKRIEVQKPEITIGPSELSSKFIIAHNPSRVMMGYLQVISNIPAPTILVKANGKPILEETLTGNRLEKNLNPGTYQIELTAKGYRKWTSNLTLKRGSNNPVEVNLESALGSVQIDLGELKATDKSLQIFIDEQNVKFAAVSDTPNQCRIRDIEEGTRKLKIMRGSEVVLERSLTVEGGEIKMLSLAAKTTNLLNVPTTGMLVLTTNVPTAQVIIKAQGKEALSKTIQNRRLELQLAPGEYEIEITAGGKYKSWKRPISIRQGTLIDRDAELVSSLGTISIDLGSLSADDKQLQITLDERPVTPIKVTANKVELRDVDEAAHKVKIKHPSFAESTYPVNVYGGQYSSISIAVKSLAISLTINSLPGTKISIGNLSPKTVPANGKLVIPNLPAGQYAVKAELAGHAIAVQSRFFDAGKDYEFDLKPIRESRHPNPTITTPTVSSLSSIKLQFSEPIGNDAQILVNGQKPNAGKVNRLERLVEIRDLSTGHYTIQIRHPQSGTTDLQEVDVEAATKIQIPVRFATRLVKLTVKSQAGTDIYVNGEFKGRLAGNELPIQLPPGEYRLKAVNDRFEELEKPVALDKDATLELPLTPVISSAKFNEEFTSLQNWTATKWQLDQKKNEVFMVVQGTEIGFLKDRKYTDFTMRFTLSFAKNNRKGAVWLMRARDEQNYYLFQLIGPKGSSPGVFRSFVIKGGAMVKQFEERVPIKLDIQDDQIHIFVEAVGSKIVHRISSTGSPTEKPVTFSELDDSSFSSGRLGFMTREGEEFWIRAISVVPQ
ncbi:MAG: caspase family protein [Acidobacteriota bacterium]